MKLRFAHHSPLPTRQAIKDHESQVSRDKINDQEIELKSSQRASNTITQTRSQQEFDLVGKK